ncbi:mitochondrial ATP synthase epsilon chain-domain-containing protein [Leucosporidium creatinivorum]|uniref:Mitochondrial ATP synthase epsilon chain-domain-containing protein n=1 Tax=Leucosporidium creatinivorum TaxID=106004 RepID=A0A1Y2FX76_9BASI|nr:mitochondrial ATP synthase epsilon chain-domain-containing protein [Leucosporidium creatinivorum]
MSWRGTLTFNKYISIAARATRSALKEEQRAIADKRGTVTLKWQTWKEGKGTVAEWVVPPVEEAHK